MTTQSKVLWVVGVVVVAGVAVNLGVPPGTLLIVGVLVLCPAAMYFGMRGMGQPGGQQRSGTQKGPRESQSKPPADEDKGSTTQTK